MTRSSIWGTGRSLPERVITNADLEKLVDTSDEWLTSRTGIKERRIAATDESTATSSVVTSSSTPANPSLFSTIFPQDFAGQSLTERRSLSAIPGINRWFLA